MAKKDTGMAYNCSTRLGLICDVILFMQLQVKFWFKKRFSGSVSNSVGD